MGNRDVAVASLAEAWIETTKSSCYGRALWSPPSRRRGLKPKIDCRREIVFESPPSRRRGLKQRSQVPFTLRLSRLPRGGVD